MKKIIKKLKDWWKAYLHFSGSLHEIPGSVVDLGVSGQTFYVARCDYCGKKILKSSQGYFHSEM